MYDQGDRGGRHPATQLGERCREYSEVTNCTPHSWTYNSQRPRRSGSSFPGREASTGGPRSARASRAGREDAVTTLASAPGVSASALRVWEMIHRSPRSTRLLELCPHSRKERGHTGNSRSRAACLADGHGRESMDRVADGVDRHRYVVLVMRGRRKAPVGPGYVQALARSGSARVSRRTVHSSSCTGQARRRHLERALQGLRSELIRMPAADIGGLPRTTRLNPPHPRRDPSLSTHAVCFTKPSTVPTTLSTVWTARDEM